jgi:hypothetical protein
LKKTEIVQKTTPVTATDASESNDAEEAKPILRGQTRSIKIVDLQVRKRRRNPANCKYCNGLIEDRYALSKGSRTGARYYHIACAIRVGFDIAVPVAAQAPNQ